MPRLLLSALSSLTVLLASAAVASAPAEPTAYDTLAALEARVATIGFRLTTANAAWCPDRQAQFGWIWGDPRLYGTAQRAAARAAYGASDTDAPYIAAVAPGSPAASVGFGVGIAVATVNGVAIVVQNDGDPFARIAALEKRLAALPPGTAAEIGGPDGRRATLAPVAGCVSDFRVDARDKAAGAADGRLVLISAGLARFAANDDELAAAVAHELAHNILRHRARLDAARVDRGLMKQFGRNARLFRQTEVEADRLSVWLLAGAGYDPGAAVRFWTAFGQREGRPLFQAGTHPRWQDRVQALSVEAATIAAERAAGATLRPPLIDNPPPLE